MDNSPPRDAALIVNARSRRGRHMYRDACRLLEESGVAIVSRTAVRDPAGLEDAVRRAVMPKSPW